MTRCIPIPRKDVTTPVRCAAPCAYEGLVDRLLAGPRYGERWTRHWLDLVRYVESDGFRLNKYRAKLAVCRHIMFREQKLSLVPTLWN